MITIIKFFIIKRYALKTLIIAKLFANSVYVIQVFACFKKLLLYLKFYSYMYRI